MTRKKRGPGRPVSTGSRSTPVVSFRLGKTDHHTLVAWAKLSKMRPNALAKSLVMGDLDRAREGRKSTPGTE